MDGAMIIQICFAIMFAVVFIIMLFVFLGIVIARWVCERRYKKAVIDIIKRGLQKEDEKVLDDLQTQYVSCSANLFGVVLTNISILNARVLSELNVSTYKRYHDDLGEERDSVTEKLEKIIKLWNDKSMFSYERMDRLVCEIGECNDLEKMQMLSVKAKNLYETCLFYCEGRIFEKEAQIQTLEYEIKCLKKKRIGVGVTGVIGVVSGIITIITTITGIL